VQKSLRQLLLFRRILGGVTARPLGTTRNRQTVIGTFPSLHSFSRGVRTNSLRGIWQGSLLGLVLEPRYL
jgi:hypothetical protein